mgnify:FL=1
MVLLHITHYTPHTHTTHYILHTTHYTLHTTPQQQTHQTYTHYTIGGSSFFLARQLGYSKALELSLEGKPIHAKQCLELSLANKVVKKDELLTSALQWATTLAEKPPFAVGLTKSAINYSLTHTLGEVIGYEAYLQQFCRVSKGLFIPLPPPHYSN